MAHDQRPSDPIMEVTPCGAAHLMVTIRSRDQQKTEGEGLSSAFLRIVAADIEQRTALGWRLISHSVIVTGYTGTAGSVLTNSGENRARDVAVSCLYEAPGLIPRVSANT